MRIVLLVIWTSIVAGCGTNVADPSAGRASLSARETCRELNLREVQIDTIFRVFVSAEEGEDSVTLQLSSTLPQCAPEKMDDCIATTGQSRDQCVAQCLGCVAAVAAEQFSR